MRLAKRSGPERQILMGMIVDQTVLSNIAPKWQREGLFASPWANLVGSWCCKFYDKYDKPPGKSIQGLFESWASRVKDEESQDAVSQFLDGLSGEYSRLKKEINSGYVLDLAKEHFNRVQLQRLKDALEGDLDSDKLAEAEKRIHEFNRVEIGAGAGVDVLHDIAAIQNAFEEKSEPLIIYPGALGRFYHDALERDAFVAFMSAEKRGKTWALVDMAWVAMLQRRRVAFFEVGDMSQSQILRRFMIRAAKRPLKPKTIIVPRKIHPGEPPEVETEELEYTKKLNWRVAWRACQKVLKYKVKSQDPYLRLSCHPNSTINVAGIKSVLRGWERQGWIPDVIIIDYADILAPPAGIADGREQINQTWKDLRALSQTLHCLVVTATQSDASSYTADVLNRTHFSNDKRKFAHVTGMVGINVSSDEKKQGLRRLNWIVLRESDFPEDKCVNVAGCLDIGNPCICSCF